MKLKYKQDIFLKNKNLILNNKHKKLKIIIIGAGGTGSNIAELLVRGGFENISIIDKDKVDNSNIERQNFISKDVGKYKVTCLKKRLNKINKNINIKTFKLYLNSKNISILKEYDIIIDATDNFETRKLINNFSYEFNKVWIYSGTIKSEAICSVIKYDSKNDYIKIKNLLFDNKENISSNDVGILPSSTYLIASIIYIKLLKYILLNEKNNILKIDLWNEEIHKLKFKI
jgi:adenylyltransferase/sulfurtransferase